MRSRRRGDLVPLHIGAPALPPIRDVPQRTSAISAATVHRGLGRPRRAPQLPPRRCFGPRRASQRPPDSGVGRPTPLVRARTSSIRARGLLLAPYWPLAHGSARVRCCAVGCVHSCSTTTRPRTWPRSSAHSPSKPRHLPHQPTTRRQVLAGSTSRPSHASLSNRTSGFSPTKSAKLHVLRATCPSRPPGHGRAHADRVFRLEEPRPRGGSRRPLSLGRRGQGTPLLAHTV